MHRSVPWTCTRRTFRLETRKCGRFARKSIRPMAYNTLQRGENTFRGVILVTLGFHMSSYCLSMHIPFFRLKDRQICFGRIDLVWAKRPDTQTRTTTRTRLEFKFFRVFPKNRHPGKPFVTFSLQKS